MHGALSGTGPRASINIRTNKKKAPVSRGLFFVRFRIAIRSWR